MSMRNYSAAIAMVASLALAQSAAAVGFHIASGTVAGPAVPVADWDGTGVLIGGFGAFTNLQSLSGGSANNLGFDGTTYVMANFNDLDGAVGIAKWDATGTLLEAFGATVSLGALIGSQVGNLAYDGSSYYVLDHTTGNVARWDAAGNLLNSFAAPFVNLPGSQTSKTLGFDGAFFYTLDPNDGLAPATVARWDAAGNLLNSHAAPFASLGAMTGTFASNLAAGAPVPEPGTLLLLGSGIFGLAVQGRRRA